jgi:hypothetical protein
METLTYDQQVGALVLSLIEAHGETVQSVSQAVGLPYVTLHRRLKYGDSFRLRELRSVAQFLGVRTQELLPEEPVEVAA